ncbi:MAG: phosphatidate cytidylyltransferase [Candidatus Obscuribacterales bacterium]|nr:phosphatidate cytidylyltransferase [Candidatus Obscuribacterales bacterium]
MTLDPIVQRTLIIVAGFFIAAGLGVFGAELKGGKPDENLRKRYFAWYMIAPVVLIPSYFGGLPFAVLVCTLALWCLREFFGVVNLSDTPAFRWVGRLGGIALILAAFLETTPNLISLEALGFGRPFFFYVLPVFIIMLVLSTPVLLQRYEGMLAKEAFTIFGILYFGWFLGHLVFLRNLNDGFGCIIYLTMSVALNDVMAYTVGRICGKHKLAPLISPKKTVEGAIGGLVGSLIAAAIFGYAVPTLNAWQLVGAAVSISIAAPLGDLIISVIKRDMSVKDSGNLIPGHGGLLDRCDSIIFATPVFYYYVLFIEVFSH